MKSTPLETIAPDLSMLDVPPPPPRADEEEGATESGTIVTKVALVVETTREGAVLRIVGHDQTLAKFEGPNAIAAARQALVHVQRAIVKHAYQAAYVYQEVVAREFERIRLEEQLRSMDSGLTKLQTELRTLTEY